MLAGVAAFFLSPGAVRQYLAQRVDDLKNTFETLASGAEPAVTSGQVSLGSGVQRANLSEAALEVFLDHWIVGVGANGVPAAIGRLTGTDGPAHNSYLETLALGGIFGLALLVYYVISVILLVRSGSRALKKSVPLEQKSLVRAIRLVIIVIAIVAGMLTLNYIALFWLPMILAIGLKAMEEPDPEVSS
jgi:O-antigen ligase